MNADQERRLGDLTVKIIELADAPDLAHEWLDLTPDEVQSRILEARQEAAFALWDLWREIQIKSDLAA